jgi:uncharacterized protein (TIGR02302 family)
MTQQNTPETDLPLSADTTVRRRLALAWLALGWERLWLRLWVVGAAVGVFIVILLTDVLPSFHWVIHSALVLGAAVGIGYLMWRRLRGFTWPTRSEARARLETTSPVAHRPLTAIEDSLAAGATAVQQWMWRLHQQRAREDLDRLRVKAPAPGVANHDYFALRAAVVLALFVAVLGGWNDMGSRVARGVAPLFGGVSNASVKLWVTPPAYTGLSPLYLETPAPSSATAPTTLDIPAGSTALTIVTGTSRDTALEFADVTAPLEKLADETQRGEANLKQTARLAITQGRRTIAGWDVNWIADNAPEVSMPSPPAEAARWRLRIDYMARDDYGIDAVTARITRPDDTQVAPIELPLSLPASGGNVFVHQSVHDLGSHIWAGQNVVVTLTATDHAGQSTQSAPAETKLPERIFTHPVSKELARWRKDLFNKPQESLKPVLQNVDNLLGRPQSFGGEPIVHLTLSTARYRMVNEQPQEALRTVPELLWHAAVRIEDGNLVNAEQRLADAERALREAIERGASPEEIAQKMADLKQAVAEYAKAMAEKNGGEQGFTKNENARIDAIEEAMKQLQEMSDTGSEAAAKQALENLQEQLQALREGEEPRQAAEESPDVQQAKEMLKKMQELAEEQAQLLNENFDQAQQAEESGDGSQQAQSQQDQGMRGENEESKPGQGKGEANAQDVNAQNSSSAQQAAAKQEALRQKLNEVMKELEKMTGKPSESLSQAEIAMGDARDALRSANWKQGAQGQSDASAKLQQGMEQAQEELMQVMMDKGYGGAIERAEPAAVKFSPLGAKDGRRGGQKVVVPTEPDTQGMAQRVRVILDEIRKRSADRTRPESEQDYLRRLERQY